ncbi:MAG: metal ABC transporter permease [Pirellulales bacterium]|nr:metal ABC transporter permease [Pirellulales bacterium]
MTGCSPALAVGWPTWLVSDAAAIIATGAVTAAACAVLGSFLVLRRMSMMGDAISHAVLPGIAAAFLITQSYSVGPLLVGAIVAGLATAALTQSLHHYARVPADASMGVVFTSLFALGVVLITQVKGVHFDKQCVFEGALELTPLYVVTIAGVELPRALVVGGVVLAMNLLIVALLWKELKLSSFDPALSETMGFSAGLLHYLLMALTAITAVASFEAVGSILVVAMLIVPAATAHLLVDRLGPMVFLSAALGAVCSGLGYALAAWFDVNIAGMMAVVAGGLYGLAVLLSPQYGILSAVVRNARLALAVVRDDLLGVLYRLEELGTEHRLAAAEACAAVGGGLLARRGLAGLLRAGQVTQTTGRLELTPAGRDAARQLVRAHRLWENYLVQHLGLPLDHVHAPADRVEHYIDATMKESLEQKLDDARTDPHGREIPN